MFSENCNTGETTSVSCPRLYVIKRDEQVQLFSEFAGDKCCGDSPNKKMSSSTNNSNFNCGCNTMITALKYKAVNFISL
jgi:hypothetical protein